jgi:hypothetical protein
VLGVETRPAPRTVSQVAPQGCRLEQVREVA